MNFWLRIVIVLAVVSAAAGIVVVKARAPENGAVVRPISNAREKLPLLLDLGADKCVPCKKMAPILEKLRGDFAERFDVVFIDVWKNKEAATEHGVRLIPTQIFFDEHGEELSRHVGFFSREDILAEWRKHGYAFGPAVAGDEPAPAETDAADAPDDGPVAVPVEADDRERVVAYYFHRTTRCQSCLDIEEYSSNAIGDAFAGELRAGRLELRPLDMEQPENVHFEKEFELEVPTLVLVHERGGEVIEWKALEKAWDLVYSASDLGTYVVGETREFMKLAPASPVDS